MSSSTANNTDLSSFIHRAETAEKKLALLSERVAQLEGIINSLSTNTAANNNTNNNNTNSSNINIPAVDQQSLLTKLTELRSLLVIESESKHKLLIENSKLNYRIAHLVKNMQ